MLFSCVMAPICRTRHFKIKVEYSGVKPNQRKVSENWPITENQMNQLELYANSRKSGKICAHSSQPEWVGSMNLNWHRRACCYL